MEQESLLTDVEFTPVLASTGQRFVNYFIDIIIYDVIISLFKAIFSIGVIQFYAPDSVFVILIRFLMSYVFFVVLYFLSEVAFKGRTIGKFITNTKAVNENGTEMETKTVLIRSLCRIIPFEPVSALFGRPWHDKLSRTYVIDMKRTSLKVSY